MPEDKDEGRPARQSPDGSSRMAGGRPKAEGKQPGIPNGKPAVRQNNHKPKPPQPGLRIGFGKIDKNGVRINKEFSLNFRKFFVWLLVLTLFVPALLGALGNMAFKHVSIPLSQAVEDIKTAKVDKIQVADQELILYYKERIEGPPAESQGIQAGREGPEGKIRTSRKETGEPLSQLLERNGVDPASVQIEVAEKGLSGSDLMDIGLNGLFLVGTVFFFLWMMRMRGGGMDPMFGIGKSNAKLFTKGKQNIRFTDVGGLKEAKQEVEEIVDFLKHPKKYQKLGARTPKGVLLIGPSGTGKTLLARAIAGEADVPFYSMAGSEFMEMLVGVGASVTGDTPILVKSGGETQLIEIGKFVDQFYKDKQLSVPIPVSGIQTLGLRPEVNGFWGSRSASRPVFGGSAWQDVNMVFRHRANEIYQIDYLGGNLRTTGDHSVFVRESGGIRPKEVRHLKPGDLLVNLPMNTRAWDADKKYTVHQIKQHEFPAEAPRIFLDVWQDDPAEIAKYEFAMAQQGVMTQYAIADSIGVSQMTVSHWQNGIHGPQKLSKKLVKLDLPETVKVTKELCKLFGYYIAEGRGASGPEFTFNINEGQYVEEVADLMAEIFGLTDPIIRSNPQEHTVRILYRSKHLGRFFETHCGAGAHRKHLPDWLWDMPKDYFLAFLEAYTNGDGYITKTGKLSAVSVSRQLIRQLAWLCSMHGIKVGVKHEILPAGRIIRDKPLPATESWNLIIGKTSNPFINIVPHPYQFKRCLVKKVTKKPFDGFVYDLCGVDNEAFFGGEKPILLHNSRTRDLFQTAKSHAPSIIFIDEIDAIGQARGPALTGGHGEREQTLNQILVEMDGFEPNEQVSVIAASVTGDTPVLIRKDGLISLRPIGEIIDEYYGENHTDDTINVDDLEVLGLVPKRGRGIPRRFLYFGGSRFVKPSGVFRHRLNRIYELKFLGGTIRTTGDHSVFVRTRRGIEPKQVRQLKAGDFLVQLPTKIHRPDLGRREIRAHQFDQHFHRTIDVYEPSEDQLIWQHQFLFAQQHAGMISQANIAGEIGVEQTTVSAWLRGKATGPRAISREYFKHKLPEKVVVTPEFCRLLGYYAAEGYSRKELDFCFATDESEYIDDVVNLTEKIFGLRPDRIRHITPGAVNIIYYSKPLALLFAHLCGKGAHHKHLPPFLFEAPFTYYQEFLRGCFRGDGYLDRHGRGELSSVSRQLILELNWLSAMHGIKTYVRSWLVPAGRIIGNGKGLPETTAWRLGWGKTMNPLDDDIDRTRSSMVRAVVRSVKELPFAGYVYDFVGCDGEAFFGGESPVLLHNTNRPDTLDPALIRPGRFDRRVVLDFPDIEERQKILMIHAKNKPITNGFSWEKVAKRTVGFSGADLENMLNEAAIMAARKGAEAITMDDIEEAATKVKLGPEKRRLQSALERKMTAYHEAGHAVVAHSLVHTDPVHRISIVSRGMALGFTEMAPLADKVHQTKSELVEKMAAMLGGRAAEELIFNELTGGASSDIDRVTQVARKMVVYLGMSDLGPIDFGQQYDTTEYGLRYYEPSSVSDKTQEAIDKEIKRLVDNAYKSALEILRRQRKPLDRVAAALVEKETLDGEEFAKLFGKPKLGSGKN